MQGFWSPFGADWKTAQQCIANDFQALTEEELK